MKMHLKKGMFVASRGLLMSFMKHFGLFLRRKTTAVQKDPEHLIDKIVSYVIQVRGVS